MNIGRYQMIAMIKGTWDYDTRGVWSEMYNRTKE